MPRSELDAWSYKAVFEDEAEQDPGYHTGNKTKTFEDLRLQDPTAGSADPHV